MGWLRRLRLGRTLRWNVSSLAQFQTNDKDFQLMQNSWATVLNPVINNPSNKAIILKNVSLLAASAPNVVNHKLGRNLQGWRLVRVRASATIYDTQDANQTPNLTLNLRTSADVTVDLEVF